MSSTTQKNKDGKASPKDDIEVVVDEEDRLFFAGLHLVADRLGAHEARLAIVELPNRAEVAIETAASAREDGCHGLGHSEEVSPVVFLDETFNSKGQ